MAITQDLPTWTRKVLVIAAFGGISHATPMLEIAEILHQRGFQIEIGCLAASSKTLLKMYPFISKVHIIASDLPPEQEDAMFRRMDENADGFKNAMSLLDSIWVEMYQNLDKLVANERPDFIFVDDMDAAGLDVAKKYTIPLATHHAQMPKHVAAAKHIPGVSGLQYKQDSSEHATLWERIYEEIHAIKLIISMKDLIIANGKMRKAYGVPPKKPSKHASHLMLVNSCWGVDNPKDVPPLIVQCGPILADEYSSLGEFEPFLSSRKRVVYVAFGSKINLPQWRIQRMIDAMNGAIAAGAIDGVIWGLRVDKLGLKVQANSQSGADSLNALQYHAILENRNPNWKITAWAPQRAILSHPSTALFMSHTGTQSAMEGLYHGVPFIAMAFFGDQKRYSKRLRAAGVALEIDKDNFAAAELTEKIRTITEDQTGSFGRNVERMRRLAVLGSKHKHYAADMIEEVLADHELRFENTPDPVAGVSKNFDGFGQALRPMHLETAPARMSWIKANNIDMWIVGLGALCAMLCPTIFLTHLSASKLWAIIL